MIQALPLFKALVEPVRIRIYLLLKKSPLTVSELSEILDLSQSNTSHHIKALRDLGLLSAEKTGQHTYYGLDARELAGEHKAEQQRRDTHGKHREQGQRQRPNEPHVAEPGLALAFDGFGTKERAHRALRGALPFALGCLRRRRAGRGRCAAADEFQQFRRDRLRAGGNGEALGHGGGLHAGLLVLAVVHSTRRTDVIQSAAPRARNCQVLQVRGIHCPRKDPKAAPREAQSADQTEA